MVWIYTLVAVIIVSLISLIGVFTLSMKKESLEKVLIYFVSLSTGTLLGDAFIHLVPDAYAQNSSRVLPAVYLLSGILIFFVLEKYVHWRHCHKIASAEHPHPFSYIILLGDGLHNLIDGMIIAASFLVSLPVGVATTLAVIFHEIPHEIGNFGSLVYGGFSRSKALLFNFLSATVAILGAVIVLLISFDTTSITKFMIPFAAGGFIYVASSDFIPELHKETLPYKSFVQLVFFVVGIALMASLLLFE
jgi:zinc and cadmium transporter